MSSGKLAIWKIALVLGLLTALGPLATTFTFPPCLRWRPRSALTPQVCN